ncbi:hypothetical protein B5M42_002225 [Paenibacillus athensensis]|uniref:Uncharacterized protein n=1 Tax=Paenibacillus athensensis TaxID=1967502 RepID=A0A4Y8QC71_9BACL|nr:hypothetical protein [Paenibacillus athensensis]MCD1257655.1 hypothetical protein [Paenibacillus athensensis]
MHESEWLPKILLKTDLVHICTVLNLSVDGFRISSLASRPVEQLRGLVGSSLRSGIGKKKRLKNSPNAIPLDIFYEELAADARKEQSTLPVDDYEAFMSVLVSDGNWRPYQKLALLYDQYRETYTTHYDKLVQNALNKTDLFAGIYAVNESQIIEQLQYQLQMPSMAHYMDFVAWAGWEARYASIKDLLQEKPDGVSKLLAVNGLKAAEERFLGQLALLPDYPQLAQGVFAYCIETLLSNQQEAGELKGLLQSEGHKSIVMLESIQSLKRTLSETEQQKADMLSVLDHMKQQLKKAENETAAAETAKLVSLEQTSEHIQKLSQQIELFAGYKVLWETFLPHTSDAFIVTEHLDPCLQELFRGLIYSKAQLLHHIEMKPEILQNKTIFVDRSLFTNSKEWIELRHFFKSRGITYEEFTDDAELILGYATNLKDSVTEE